METVIELEKSKLLSVEINGFGISLLYCEGALYPVDGPPLISIISSDKDSVIWKLISCDATNATW